MELVHAAEALGLGATLEPLQVAWTSSQCHAPRSVPDFLQADFVATATRGVNLPEAIVAEAISVARRVAQQPALCALAWHCHWCLYREPGIPQRIADRWPSLAAQGPEIHGCFYLLVLLSRYPHMRTVHDGHALPDDVRRATLEQIFRRGRHCGEQMGGWGLDGHAARWLAHTLRGEIYAIGRLLYQFERFPDAFRVYRHDGAGHVRVFCEPDLRFDAEGHRVHGDADVEAWRSRLTTTPDRIIGHPVKSDGIARRETIALPTAAWNLMLQRDDAVLSVHIPTGGPLDPDACDHSFRDALAFLPRHFPERPFNAFWCASWLLDTQLQDWLPPAANLVQFLRAWHLLPAGIGPEPLQEAVFGDAPTDLNRAPRNTSLQRAVLDHLASGRKIRPRGGHGVRLPGGPGGRRSE